MKYIIILLMLGLCSCTKEVEVHKGPDGIDEDKTVGIVGHMDKYEDKVNNVVCYRTFYSDRLSCVYVGNNK